MQPRVQEGILSQGLALRSHNVSIVVVFEFGYIRTHLLSSKTLFL